ncbi:conserved hypothetical protein [Theileria orientalis strain Shintoku]|uniref:Transmembrane protein n=1 Tax=Theileria orientalis strain Shintoku TaxID=869250 RepID=J7MCH5_THEOR|nr:conserved hypothetical protein [Theileria orientalis strain Shintoku]PVC49817.1 hypothetical protein MACL_00002692 [Theileria orientalis]BAM42517.1 conserved hypothetical protein [Theileria orientalis strain Shintoku]|eukprot:XP_009692818.1 conserved hypothetical protein [Theileria orientalis strain Shintoku]
MNSEALTLVSNYEDELVKRRNRGRLVVTLVLCSVPLLDASFVIFCLCLNKFSSLFGMINCFCIFYILVAIATTLTGYYGVFRQNHSALRTSINLFTLQNLLILFISGSLFFLFLSFRHFFNEHHAPRFMKYFETHRGFGIFIFVFNILMRLTNLFLTWYCGELEAAFEVLNRLKHFKDKAPNDNEHFQIDIKDDFEQIY